LSKFNSIKGITAEFDLKLVEAGVVSLGGLLEACATKKGRTELAKQTGIAAEVLLKWANHADLARINGIGKEYAELLEAAGVDTVPELATRKAENLYAKIVEVNAANKHVTKVPSQQHITDWITQAANLPRAIHY